MTPHPGPYNTPALLPPAIMTHRPSHAGATPIFSFADVSNSALPLYHGINSSSAVNFHHDDHFAPRAPMPTYYPADIGRNNFVSDDRGRLHPHRPSNPQTNVIPTFNHLGIATPVSGPTSGPPHPNYGTYNQSFHHPLQSHQNSMVNDHDVVSDERRREAFRDVDRASGKPKSFMGSSDSRLVGEYKREITNYASLRCYGVVETFFLIANTMNSTLWSMVQRYIHNDFSTIGHYRFAINEIWRFLLEESGGTSLKDRVTSDLSKLVQGEKEEISNFLDRSLKIWDNLANLELGVPDYLVVSAVRKGLRDPTLHHESVVNNELVSSENDFISWRRKLIIFASRLKLKINSVQPRESKPKEVCRNFLAGRCVMADKCRYQHIVAAASNLSPMTDATSQSSTSSATEKPVRQRICYSFAATGKCSKGDQCRYAHVQGTPATATASGNVSAKQPTAPTSISSAAASAANHPLISATHTSSNGTSSMPTSDSNSSANSSSGSSSSHSGGGRLLWIPAQSSEVRQIVEASAASAAASLACGVDAPIADIFIKHPSNESSPIVEVRGCLLDSGAATGLVSAKLASCIVQSGSGFICNIPPVMMFLEMEIPQLLVIKNSSLICLFQIFLLRKPHS
jgi:hypothetical protein